MKALWALAPAVLLLCACDNNNSNTVAEVAPKSPSENTVRACAFDPDSNDDKLHPEIELNIAEDPIFIESTTLPMEDIDLQAMAEEERMLAAFAVMPFTVPAFSDTFAGLMSSFICTREHFELNKCNWEASDAMFQHPMRVQTEFNGPQSFVSTIQSKKTGQWQTMLVAQGVLGDIGNGTHVYYEQGIPAVTRTFTRDSSGKETIAYASELTNWTATESANCSGNMSFSDIKDGRTIAFAAQWSFNGNRTSGSLEYSDSSWDEAVKLEW